MTCSMTVVLLERGVVCTLAPLVALMAELVVLVGVAEGVAQDLGAEALLAYELELGAEAGLA